MNQIFSLKFPWGSDTNFPEKLKSGSKIHTIRKISNRFSIGQLQYPCYWSGRPYFSPVIHFMDPLLLISKQHIKIEWVGSHKHIDLGPSIFIDGRFLYMDEINTLAKNDGFDSTKDFFRWFDKDFEGEIRHYTYFKY